MSVCVHIVTVQYSNHFKILYLKLGIMKVAFIKDT